MKRLIGLIQSILALFFICFAYGLPYGPGEDPKFRMTIEIKIGSEIINSEIIEWSTINAFRTYTVPAGCTIYLSAQGKDTDTVIEGTDSVQDNNLNHYFDLDHNEQKNYDQGTQGATRNANVSFTASHLGQTKNLYYMLCDQNTICPEKSHPSGIECTITVNVKRIDYIVVLPNPGCCAPSSTIKIE